MRKKIFLGLVIVMLSLISCEGMKEAFDYKDSSTESTSRYFVNRGIAFEKSKDYKQARQNYEETLSSPSFRLHYRKSRMLLAIGNTFLKEGNYKQAKVSYQKIIELSTGESIKAIAKQRLAIAEKQRVNQRKELANLGITFEKSKDYKQARQNYEKALSVSLLPDEKYSLLSSIANTFIKEGNYKQARQNYEKALSLSRLPDEKSQTLLAIGNTLLSERNYEQAKVFYRKIIELSTEESIKAIAKQKIAFAEKQRLNQREELANLGIAFEKSKDYKQARQYYEKALSLSRLPDEKYPLLFTIANTFIKEGNYKQARQSYEKTLGLSRLHYQKSQTFLAIGNTFLSERNYEQAKVSYQKIIELSTGTSIKAIAKQRIAIIEKQLQSQKKNVRKD